MGERIVLVHNFYQIGGGEHTVFRNEKQLLEENGHYVVPYTRTNDELKKSVWKKILLPFSTCFSWRTYREIKRLIKEERISVVHCHNTFPLISPAVYYACFRMHVPVLQTVHNFRLVCPGGTCFRNGAVCEECLKKKSLLPALRYGCYRKSRLGTAVVVGMLWVHRKLGAYRKLNYIFLTPFYAKKIAPLLNVPENRIFIKPNFCLSGGIPAPADEVDLHKFVYVGRLDDYKGIYLLAQLWLTLPKEFILKIYGSGAMETKLAAIAAQHGNIELCGFQDQNVVREDLRTACALVFPSIGYESFGLSVIESFSLGVPVLMNENESLGFVEENGTTGYRFSVNDPASLAEAIQYICKKMATLKQNCLEAYEKRYTPQRNVKDLEHIYAQIQEQVMQ